MIRRIKLIFIFFCLFQGLRAQYIDLQFDIINNGKGLSNNRTFCIEQDSTGYIWLGTQNGLNRFDGKNMKVYRWYLDQENTIPNSHINDLLVSSEGTLFVATEKGLCKYNPPEDNFIQIDLPDRIQSLGASKVAVLERNTDKEIYYSIRSFLCKLNKTTNKSEVVYNFEYGDITSILFDKNNQIWLSTNLGGLVRLTSDGGLIKRYLTSDDFGGFVHENTIYDLIEWKDKLLIATENEGIIQFDYNTEQFTKFHASTLNDNYIRKFYIDKQGRLWVNGYAGLKLYDEGKNSFYTYYYDDNNPKSIRNDINDIFQDKQNNYWVLYNNDGAGISTSLRKGFNIYNTNNIIWKPSKKEIICLANDDKGNLWLANPSNGVDIFDWAHSAPVRIRTKENDPNSIGTGGTLSLLHDGSGMWIGTYQGGLQYLNSARTQFTTYKHQADNSNSISGNDIRALALDHDNNLWVCVHGKGVDKLDRKTNKFSHFNNANSSLSNDFTYDIMVDHKDNIWVGTIYGVSKLVQGSDKFRSYTIERDSSSISNNEINYLFEDSDQQIWVGTRDGLNYYDEDKDDIFPVKGDLSNVFISSILEDQHKNLWIGTLNGLYWYEKKGGIKFHFDTSNDLPSNEFYPGACFNNGNNDLFWGTTNGVVFFNPDKLQFDTTQSKVVFTDLFVNNKKIEPHDSTNILNTVISKEDKLEFKPNHQIITFQFTAVSMIYPEKIQYAYRMEGINHEWQEIGTRNEITFTQLQPGQYTLKLKASNSDGFWNDNFTKIDILVKPPWWNTIGFRILFIVSAIGLIIKLLRYRTRRLELRSIELQNQVDIRTKELVIKNDQLIEKTTSLNESNKLLEERQEEITLQKEQLEELNKMKDRMMSIIAHDLTSSFNGLIGFSELFYLTHREGKKEDAKTAYIIFDSSKRIHDLLDNLLKWARTQTNEIKIRPEIVDVHKLVENTYKLYEFQIRKKEINFTIEDSTDSIALTDIDAFSTILRNTMSNAVKFTPRHGQITVFIEPVPKGILVKISDSGIGMSEKQIKQLLNNSEVGSTSGTEGEKGTGIGLTLTMELIEKIATNRKIVSSPGKGTTISFVLRKG